MTRRRQGRECALQILYQLDVARASRRVADLDKALEAFWRSFAFQAQVRRFAEEIVRGVIEQATAIDGALKTVSKKWRVERLAPVDRNILRLGLWELLYTDTPPAVVIDEAVELAKRFGTETSPAFVNGLLDQLQRDRASAKKD